MRIQIPDETKSLIEKHKVRGDFVAISRLLTKSERKPSGDASRSVDVRNAIKTNVGDIEVVRMITEYYGDKVKAIEELKSMSHQ